MNKKNITKKYNNKRKRARMVNDGKKMQFICQKRQSGDYNHSKPCFFLFLRFTLSVVLNCKHLRIKTTKTHGR